MTLISKEVRPRVQRSPGSAALAPYLLLLPALTLFGLFVLYPMLRSLLLSFSGPLERGGGFVGLDNYTRLLRDPNFWTALGNSALILGVQVPVTVALALGLAVTLSSKRFPWRNFFRSAYFLPSILSLVAVSVLFRLLFNEDIGLVNALLEKLGLGKVPFSTQPWGARLLLMLVLVWRYTGFLMVIYLAGIVAIRADLYEAAQLDGASGWQQFRFVTVPQLRPVLVFTVTLVTIFALQVFEESYLITGGGPANATLTLGLYLYRVAFVNVEFPYASAISWALLLLVGTLSLLQVRFSDRTGES